MKQFLSKWSNFNRANFPKFNRNEAKWRQNCVNPCYKLFGNEAILGKMGQKSTQIREISSIYGLIEMLVACITHVRYRVGVTIIAFIV